MYISLLNVVVLGGLEDLPALFGGEDELNVSKTRISREWVIPHRANRRHIHVLDTAFRLDLSVNTSSRGSY